MRIFHKWKTIKRKIQIAIAADFHIILLIVMFIVQPNRCIVEPMHFLGTQSCHMFNNFLCLENMRHAQWITGIWAISSSANFFFLCALSHSLRRLNRFGFSRLARRAHKILLVSEFKFFFEKISKINQKTEKKWIKSVFLNIKNKIYFCAIPSVFAKNL